MPSSRRHRANSPPIAGNRSHVADMHPVRSWHLPDLPPYLNGFNGDPGGRFLAYTRQRPPRIASVARPQRPFQPGSLLAPCAQQCELGGQRICRRQRLAAGRDNVGGGTWRSMSTMRSGAGRACNGRICWPTASMNCTASPRTSASTGCRIRDHRGPRSPTTTSRPTSGAAPSRGVRLPAAATRSWWCCAGHARAVAGAQQLPLAVPRRLRATGQIDEAAN